MAERPILFSGDMVRAILAGRKTQTRLVVQPQPDLMQAGGTIRPHPFDVGVFLVENWEKQDRAFLDFGRCENIRSPYAAGDTLWVRETWAAPVNWNDVAPKDIPEWAGCWWLADDNRPVSEEELRWRPSIHMPRWASRITLRVTGVRVEWLQEISEEDAQAEGVVHHDGRGIGHSGWRPNDNFGMVGPTPIHAFAWLWQSIYGPESWEANPWVWVVEFEQDAPHA